MLLVVCDSLSNPIDEEDWLFVAVQTDEEDWLIVAVQDVNEEKKKMNNCAKNC